MDRFAIRIDQMAPGVMRVALAGELDLNRAYTFDAELRALEEMDPSTIVLDLRDLRFMDSTGLARIVAASRRARRADWRLVIVRSCAAVQRVFAVTALDQHFEMVSEPEAVLQLH